MKKVVIIGSGNVATSLAHGLSRRCQVAQIYSRTLVHAQLLADAVGCPHATDDLQELLPDADAYIIAVKDDAIADVITSLPDNGALWLHTSGSKPISLFAGHRRRYGVLWPMQSFSREVVVPLDEVHFFAEASGDKRRQLHIASVFSCNFANHMWTLASEVLHDADLPFEAMMPLIRTTVAKLDRLSPAKSQTGPAIRHDNQVINSHLGVLDGDKRELYRLLSQSIMNRNPLDDYAK